MDTKKQTSILIVASSLIAILATSIAGVTNSPTWGQQNTTNATAGTMVNQTSSGTLANLTSQDFEPLQDSLNEAREAIHDNDTAAALEALNNTQTQLSKLNSPEPAEEEEEEASEDEGE